MLPTGAQGGLLVLLVVLGIYYSTAVLVTSMACVPEQQYLRPYSIVGFRRGGVQCINVQLNLTLILAAYWPPAHGRSASGLLLLSPFRPVLLVAYQFLSDAAHLESQCHSNIVKFTHIGSVDAHPGLVQFPCVYVARSLHLHASQDQACKGR